jgi:5-methyltetrahydropteroyltriglutamate--homocysteine methyltransferase
VLPDHPFAPSRTRTFMCAALAARSDPSEELEFAVGLINSVVAAAPGVRVGVHICRGNWSRNEATLLRGSYRPLLDVLDRLTATQLVLEYATERAGDLLPFDGKEIGLGVVNPRTDEVEPVAAVRGAVERALRLYAPERIFLNPDCGFGTFALRPMNSPDTALAKIQAMAEAARQLRGAAPARYHAEARVPPP